MADATTAEPDIIAALNAVYAPVLAAFEAWHRQEHRAKIKFRYKVLAKRYDKLVDDARDWRRSVLDRIERLGGDADSTIEGVAAFDDVGKAYADTIERLRAIYDACQAGCDAADAAGDNVTFDVFDAIQHDADKLVAKFEAFGRQIDDLGPAYLLTLV